MTGYEANGLDHPMTRVKNAKESKLMHNVLLDEVVVVDIGCARVMLPMPCPCPPALIFAQFSDLERNAIIHRPRR